MALVAKDMAEALKTGLGFQDQEVTSETVGMAQAIIGELSLFGLVNFAPFTINGICPSGGPLIDGEGAGGVILGLDFQRLAVSLQALMTKPFPSAELIFFATGIVNHLQTGLVSFDKGSVTGICTNSGTSPGPLVGEASKGKLKLLPKDVLAPQLSPLGPPTPELLSFADEFIKYMEENAEVTFATGTITGTCPAGGGPLTLGAGAGGKVL